MSKTDEKNKTPNEKKAKEEKKTETGKKTAAKKPASSSRKPAESSVKKTSGKNSGTKKKPVRASDGWREKKARLNEQRKEPKTLAERKALQEKGPIRRFLMNHPIALDLFAVPFFTFSILCIYSIASKNERPAAVWCVNMSNR
ncbi:MAG: hypothetical protein IKP86_12260, partial [Anaerolineaceae bacterium]|nr:hypothetical protein [Anaerolineaceae bacterium]